MKEKRSARKRNVSAILTSLILLSIAWSLTYYTNNIIDGTRIIHQYRVPIDGDNGNLVFHIWEPLNNISARGDRVVFLFAGFLAQQNMMYPLAREFTRLGYHVVTGDFRGHGMSDGVFPTDWTIILKDFDTFYNAVKEMNPHWNWTHIAVVGHSMGGYGASLIGNNRSAVVFTTVAIAPAPSRNILNSSIRNYMLLLGAMDQAFTPQQELEFFKLAQNDAEIGKLYGNPLEGTARKMVVENKADHFTELFNDNLLSEAISFVEMSFGYVPVSETPNVRGNQEFRLILVFAALIVGIFGIFPLFLMDPSVYTRKGTILKQIEEILAKRGELVAPSVPKIEDDNKESTNQKSNTSDRSVENVSKYPIINTINKNAIKIFRRLKNPMELVDEITQTIKSNKRIQRVKEFEKIYWKFHLLAIPIAALIFFAMLPLLWNFFTNIQILLFGIAGIASLLIIIKEVKNDESARIRSGSKIYFTTAKKVSLYFKEALEYEGTAITKTAIVILIISLIIPFALIYYSVGQNILMLIPLNRRFVDVWFFIPFTFLMLFNQFTVFKGSLNPFLPKGVSGDIAGVLLQIINKYGLFILVGFLLLPFGQYMLLIIGLFIAFDSVGTLLTVLSIRYSDHAFIAIIWTALICSVAYMGYAGIINSWEAIFGSYNVLMNIQL